MAFKDSTRKKNNDDFYDYEPPNEEQKLPSGNEDKKKTKDYEPQIGHL